MQVPERNARRATLPIWAMAALAILCAGVSAVVIARSLIVVRTAVREMNVLRGADGAFDEASRGYFEAQNELLRTEMVGQHLDVGPSQAADLNERAERLTDLIGTDGVRDARAKLQRLVIELDVSAAEIVDWCRASATTNASRRYQVSSIRGALLSLRSELTELEGRRRLDAIRRGGESTTTSSDLSAALMDLLDVSLLVESLDDIRDVDALTDLRENRLLPTLARLSEALARSETSASAPTTLMHTLAKIREGLEGGAEGDYGPTSGLLDETKNSLDAARYGLAAHARTSSLLRATREIVESLGDAADVRLADLEALTTDSLSDALWRSACLAGVGSVVLLLFATPLARGTHRRVAALQDVLHRLQVSQEQLVDITQLREALARIEAVNCDLSEARERADAANRAKSEFLAAMSHEIRTPLNGVVGTLELLNGSGLSEQQQRYIQIGKTSALSLTAVINDILDFSKVEAGKLELCPIPFELRPAIEDVMEMLAVKASEKGLEVATCIAPGLPQMVHGDPDRLRQIVINLVNNAIKFTPRGSVMLSVSPAEGGGDVVLFRIVDTGIGIPSDRLDRLFKAFSQADSSTTRKYGGTGLGLAISKRLAELMEGKVGVESRVGEGSTFWFTAKLPPAVGASPSAPRPQTLGEFQGTRVLVVDEHDEQRENLCRVLLSWGLEISSAEDGDAALTAAMEALTSRRPFGLILVDHHMPGLDGLDVTIALRSRASFEKVPLILVTSDPKLDPMVLQRLGVSASLPKPLKQSVLFDTVVTLLHGPKRAVEVPAAAGTADPAEAPGVRPTPPGKPGTRLLLAEDNEINQLIATEILSKAGYDCTVVENGRLAVAAVQESEFDVVLMDCQMPEMDGFEATREIRRLEKAGGRVRTRAGRLPIVALTANALKGDRERCLEAGMDDYTSKPIDPITVISTIESLITRVRRIADAA